MVDRKLFERLWSKGIWVPYFCHNLTEETDQVLHLLQMFAKGFGPKQEGLQTMDWFYFRQFLSQNLYLQDDNAPINAISNAWTICPSPHS